VTDTSETTTTTATTGDNVLANAQPTESHHDASDASAADPAAQVQEQAPPPQAAIEYQDFALPEGVDVDAQTMSEARELLAELNLPQEQAQRLVDFYAGKVRQFGESQAGNWVKLNEKWVSDFKADREIGGDRIAETVAAAARALERFGTPELREALIMTGAGNHPEVIRFVARVGRATSEDRFIAAAGASAGSSRSAAEVLYPQQDKAE
jgi:hypothetical protein